LVRENCLVLGKRLIEQGEIQFGIILISRGFTHDASKFFGIEWKFLHTGPNAPKEQLELAVLQHVTTNSHHPEYWDGIDKMPDIAIAEMVCDWAARSAEFGTSVKDWFRSEAVQKYKINTDSEYYKKINKYLNILTQDNFVK
jgi:hypothetical protein